MEAAEEDSDYCLEEVDIIEEVFNTSIGELLITFLLVTYFLLKLCKSPYNKVPITVSESGANNEEPTSTYRLALQDSAHQDERDNFQCNDFVIVSFSLEEQPDKTRLFLGTITGGLNEAGAYKINYLRNKTQFHYFVFPNIRDEQWTAKNQIIQKVMVRDLGRGRFSCINVDISNIH
ncbi:MAG: hypothetical protein H9Q66_04965 [Spiroplasma ixodetis]|nr:hypothetical protein [Spiroplasma ixodetis]